MQYGVPIGNKVVETANFSQVDGAIEKDKIQYVHVIWNADAQFPFNKRGDHHDHQTQDTLDQH